MKVILKENMKNLGHQGDVVEVKNGYANNYLFPRGMAVMATASNLKMLEENNRQGALKREKMKADAMSLSEQLKEMSITIGTKAGANGKIFGSITPLQVSQALKNKGFEIDRRKIEISDVKMLGNYEATLNLHRDVTVNIAVEVVAE
ncbi:MAG: 50S ribosomal protein L9 [Bacteroidia bacterium]|nr:50S ribosomal protein L9 [Bacteroidia bacterium]MCF8426043.1 50S ribosomal protein L9 [Bacteroidia bacterium]MCF8445362.1 50S ribosomal protein L9 [Bacteroidia bacterium]